MERFGRKLRLVALATLTLAGTSTFAIAQANTGNTSEGARHADKMKRFDKNGDGKLDNAERQEMHQAFQARRQQLLARFDKDHDGKLSEAERQEMRTTLSTDWFNRLDTNHDGNLTLQEFQAGAEHHGGLCGFEHDK